MSENQNIENPLNQMAKCILPLLSIRKSDAEQAEMVSQLLFGEEVIVLKKNKKWSKIKLLYDNYEGWVDNKGIQSIDKPRSTTPTIVNELWHSVTLENNRQLIVPAGAELENHTSTDDQNEALETKILNSAKMFLGIPYLWGGRSTFGIDCSGLVQTVFKMNGIALPRDARDQVLHGENVEFIDNIKPCDLIFFGEPDGNITHVGMAIGDGKIIHASGMVQIDLINHQGIFNPETQKYTHALRLIKRLL
ncbi:MAG: C40 family peptidase [Salinivirgaceae bacterium]|nr:C40 family peptidase [Salinivirgaceae bacterium]MDD4747014.1 C40 family peptidase [Salinivirgaceae bacterium]MDY0279096.1 C40 family peptidase [Salinivirgaceae bacterium]